MKRYMLFFLLLILVGVALFSCRTKKAEEEVQVTDSLAMPVDTVTTAIGADRPHYWIADLEQQRGLVMKRTQPISADSLNPANMVQVLNMPYPEIKLALDRVSNDTIFVRINNSQYLGSQMGSSGAEAYLAEVTYNLTELNGIRFVNFKFKQGDHASPGTYTRTDFIHPTE